MFGLICLVVTFRLQAIVTLRRQTDPLDIEAVALDDEHPHVVEDINYWAGKTHEVRYPPLTQNAPPVYKTPRNECGSTSGVAKLQRPSL